MPKQAHPWYRSQTDSWYVELHGKQQPLGRHPEGADQKAKGWLYKLVTPPLPEGFYQYKLHLTYASGQTRIVCDPCTRYGGATDQNSAFVIGGPKMDTV